jgi:peptidoglycan hydrolase-like protein with peptidoglycan-binding domain
MSEVELLAESAVAAAETLGRASAAGLSSSAFLESLFGKSRGPLEALSPMGAGGAAPSATALFHAIVGGASPRRSAFEQRYADRFLVLGRPGERLGAIGPRRGDLLIRVALGQGWGSVGVVGSHGLHRHDELPLLGLRFEGYPRLEPGAYVHLVEPGPRFRGFEMRFARRVCDQNGVVLPDTLLLRLEPSTKSAEPVEADPDAGATAQGAQVLRPGQSGNAVRRAQAQLNRVHADLTALRLPGLPGCPLPEDGRFTDRMAKAVQAFQQQVFTDPAQWDGNIGPATKGQLDLLAGAAVPNSAEGDGGDPNISWLQDALNRLINAGLAVDGIRGARTTAAVRQFQQSRGLTADGIVGPRTLAALRTGGEAPSLKLPTRCIGIPERQQIDHFEFGRAEVLPSHQPQIVNLAFCILESQRGKTPITTLTIVGHTDTVGSDADNDALGLRRAEAVRDQIMAAIAGISGRPASLAITVETRGEREQVPGDPALNRRVEVIAPFAFPREVPPDDPYISPAWLKIERRRRRGKTPSGGDSVENDTSELDGWVADDKFAAPPWLRIERRSRMRADVADFRADDEAFTFDPTGGQTDFGPKLRKAWHDTMQAMFKLNLDLAATTIANGLGISQADAAKHVRFFSPASRPPSIAFSKANVVWRAFPTSGGPASTATYKFFDEPHPTPSSPPGPMLRAQDEYCEWKVFRDNAGRIVRVVFTSEPPEYYSFLYDPGVASLTKFAQGLLVRLYQERCGSTAVTLADLEITGATGRKKFDPGNRWNNDHCVHLQQPNNTLGAQVNIAALASIAMQDTTGTPITSVSKLITCTNFGEPSRQSDPAIGDNVNKLARENRFLTLENPVGLYMASLNTSGWTTPDGTDAQAFWKVLKGKVDKDPRKSMIVRAEYIVPASKGYAVSDIKIGGAPIKSGSQIAEQVEMRLGALVGPKDKDPAGATTAVPPLVRC